MTATGFDERDWLEAPIFESQLVLTCTGGIYMRPPPAFFTGPDTNHRGRISYLQMCLHQRGLVSTEMGVWDILQMFRCGPGYNFFFRMLGPIMWRSSTRTKINCWR